MTGETRASASSALSSRTSSDTRRISSQAYIDRSMPIFNMVAEQWNRSAKSGRSIKYPTRNRGGESSRTSSRTRGRTNTGNMRGWSSTLSTCSNSSTTTTSSTSMSICPTLCRHPEAGNRPIKDKSVRSNSSDQTHSTIDAGIRSIVSNPDDTSSQRAGIIRNIDKSNHHNATRGTKVIFGVHACVDCGRCQPN